MNLSVGRVVQVRMATSCLLSGALVEHPNAMVQRHWHLARTPESVFTWGGDLSVQFPGLDPIPLAGPSFGSDYCLRESGCIRQDAEYR